MSRDILVDPLPPHVSFGGTVMIPNLHKVSLIIWMALIQKRFIACFDRKRHFLLFICLTNCDTLVWPNSYRLWKVKNWSILFSLFSSSNKPSHLVNSNLFFFPIPIKHNQSIYLSFSHTQIYALIRTHSHSFALSITHIVFRFHFGILWHLLLISDLPSILSFVCIVPIVYLVVMLLLNPQFLTLSLFWIISQSSSKFIGLSKS